MWASTLCPFSSSTRNMALGRGSTTVPSTSIASSLATLQLILCVGTRPEGARNAPREGRKRVYGQVRGCVHALRALDDRLDVTPFAGVVDGSTGSILQRSRRGLDQSRAVRTPCPSWVTATVCSKCADRDPSAVTTVQPSGMTAVAS